MWAERELFRRVCGFRWGVGLGGRGVGFRWGGFRWGGGGGKGQTLGGLKGSKEANVGGGGGELNGIFLQFEFRF